MSKEDLEIDDDFIAEDAEEIEEESPAQAAKTNLTKRRTIDNLLEERRLQKLLAEYDYDIDWYPNVGRAFMPAKLQYQCICMGLQHGGAGTSARPTDQNPAYCQ